MMTIASETALEEKQNEDAISMSSGASSERRKSFFRKFLHRGKNKKKDDIP